MGCKCKKYFKSKKYDIIVVDNDDKPYKLDVKSFKYIPVIAQMEDDVGDDFCYCKLEIAVKKDKGFNLIKNEDIKNFYINDLELEGFYFVVEDNVIVIRVHVDFK